MSECLVTKLKSTVDNTELGELGVIYVTVTSNTDYYIMLYSYASKTDTVKVTVLDDGVTVTGINSGTIIDDKSVILGLKNMTYPGFYISVANTTVNLKIENKYYLGYVDVNNITSYFDFNELKYYNDITELSATTLNITGDISVLNNMTNLNCLRIYDSPNITGDISVLSNMTNLEQFVCSRSSVYGDITSLSKLIKLGYGTNDTEYYNLFQFVGTQITGKMSDLFDGLYANGKTSGFITYEPNNLVENVGELYTNNLYRVYFTESGWTPSSAATTTE